jgi:hypothetical protein
MRSGPKKAGAERAATAALSLATLLAVSGCSHLHAMHWPWHHPPPPPAAPVHELDISSTALDPAAVRQFWKRNTLVVDLSAASGSGLITLKPAAGSAWPVRLAVRVTPGSIGLLEVHGEQRLSLPITPAGGKPLDLELVPRLYNSKTAQLSVSWGPASAPAP